MKSTAAILRSPDGEFELAELDLEAPGPGEVLVRVVSSGMCHTDLSMREAHRPTPYPVVLGHEGAGRVVAVGPGVNGLEEGQAVVLSCSSCGTCRYCRSGEPTYCVEMFSRNFNCCRPDGTTSFAEADGTQVGSHFFGQSSWASHVVVHASSVVPVDADDDDLTVLGPLGCGVQTGAGSVLRVLRPQPGDSIVVIGCGAVGLSAVLAAQVAGCGQIIGVDPHAGRRQRTLELGATDVVDPSAGDVAEQVLELTGGVGAHFAFDAVGAPGTFEAGVGSLAPRGTFGFVAAAGADVTAAISPRHLLFGRTITGILEGASVPQVFIPQLVELWRAGRFPFDEMIGHFDLADINAAEHASHDGSVIKPVLRMPS